jgi:hypothetical protein
MGSLTRHLELIGILAVVVSLIFVAYEIRQNTNTAAAQAVFELNEAGRQSLFLQPTDADLMALIILAEDDLDALTDIQRQSYRRWVFAFLNLYESAGNHHQRGIIDDDDMEGWQVDYCDRMSNESFRRTADSIKSHASRFRNDAASWCQ